MVMMKHKCQKMEQGEEEGKGGRFGRNSGTGRERKGREATGYPANELKCGKTEYRGREQRGGTRKQDYITEKR